MIKNPINTRIMRVTFAVVLIFQSMTCSAVKQNQADSQTQSDNDAIIRKAVAGQLNKRPEELTSDDYPNIFKLNLSHSSISDIELLAKLTNLRFLYLNETKLFLYEERENTNLFKLKNLFYKGQNVGYVLRPVLDQ